MARHGRAEVTAAIRAVLAEARAGAEPLLPTAEAVAATV
ncbi:MAG: hypothetical protein JWR00_3479, partial [Rubritepida sp.]|nr:hypothetical protein [Rubritepida sp.]